MKSNKTPTSTLRSMGGAGLLVAVLAAGALDVRAQQPTLRASVFSSGAGVSRDGVVLHGTLGQVAVGPSASGADALGAGFWHSVRPTSLVLVNRPPSAPQITEPADGEEIVLGGSPEVPFAAVWTSTTDPDGDAVSYTWQLAADDGFSPLVLHEDAGTATTFETTLGALAEALDQAGVALDDSTTLWHRVIASDGELSTEATSHFLLVRGPSVSSEDGPAGRPTRYALHDAYPNPFNPRTALPFDVPEPGRVHLAVYDLLGREVAVLVDGDQAPGRHEAVLDGRGLPAGLYVARLSAGGVRQSRAVTLVR